MAIIQESGLEIRLLRALQTQLDDRVLSHHGKDFFTLLHDRHAIKIPFFVNNIAAAVIFKLKKSAQHGETQCLPESPGSRQEGHLPAFFQDVPDKKVLVHIVQILVDEMAPAGFPDIS